MPDPLRTIVPTAEVWPCTSAEYHADKTALSNSMKEVFVKKGPRRYYLTLHGQIIRKETRDLRVGSLMHNAMEGKPFAADVDRDEAWLASSMAAALRSDPWVSAQFAEGGYLVEHTVRWLDRETNIPCKLRCDWFHPASKLFLDWKKTRSVDPADIAATAWKYGYHRQQAWYQMGMAALLGCDPLDFHFAFCFVEEDLPHEVQVVELGDLDGEPLVEVGLRQNRRALEKLARHRDQQNWRKPGSGEVIKVPAPRWAKYEEEFAYE